MHKNPYPKFKSHSPDLREYLAIDRTIMANERSLLAYLRTSLAFFAGAATLIKFFTSPLINSIGALMFIPAISLLFVGTHRYLKMRSRLQIFLQPDSDA